MRERLTIILHQPQVQGYILSLTSFLLSSLFPHSFLIRQRIYLSFPVAGFLIIAHHREPLSPLLSHFYLIPAITLELSLIKHLFESYADQAANSCSVSLPERPFAAFFKRLSLRPLVVSDYVFARFDFYMCTPISI